MSVCVVHLQKCFRATMSDSVLSWSADPDAKRVHGCIDELLRIRDWSDQRNRYAAASHILFAQLRRDGLAFTARILQAQAQAQAKASDSLPLVDQPKFVLLAHLMACLGPDLKEVGIIESESITGKSLTPEAKVEEVIRRLLDISSLDWACFLNLRALALSEWFKRYAESLLKVTRQAAQDQSDNQTR